MKIKKLQWIGNSNQKWFLKIECQTIKLKKKLNLKLFKISLRKFLNLIKKMNKCKNLTLLKFYLENF